MLQHVDQLRGVLGLLSVTCPLVSKALLPGAQLSSRLAPGRHAYMCCRSGACGWFDWLFVGALLGFNNAQTAGTWKALAWGLYHLFQTTTKSNRSCVTAAGLVSVDQHSVYALSGRGGDAPCDILSVKRFHLCYVC
jgi:hypothetical protein